MRTCEALDAIRSVAEQVLDTAVGAGTIVRPEQALEAVMHSATHTPQPHTAAVDRSMTILSCRRQPLSAVG